MITELRLKNFRGIKEGEIELAPLTILLGGNNSGKSTILEALFLAPNPFRRIPYVVGHFRAAAEVIHSLHETLDSEGYAFLLYNYTANQAEISCKLDRYNYLLLFVRNGQAIFVFTNKQKTRNVFTVTIDGEKVETYRIGIMRISRRSDIDQEVRDLFIDNTLLISSSLVKTGYKYLEENWVTITNLGIDKKVAEDVSRLVYDKYKNITIEPWLGGKLAINGLLGDGRRIRLGDLGEGVQSYIIARTLYELENPKILLWDDIEAHLNPRMLLNVAEWFYDIVENGNQVIFTTHSLEAARTIAGLNEEKAAIYLTSLENGTLKTRRLTLKDVEEYLEAGIDVRVAEPFLL